MIRSGDHALWDAAMATGPARARGASLLVAFRAFTRPFREAAQQMGEAFAALDGQRVVTTAPTRATAIREFEQASRAVRRLRRAGMTERDAAAKLYPRAGSIDVSPRRADGGTLPPRS